MSDSHWQAYSTHWASRQPPLRPNARIADQYRTEIEGVGERVLLLGVTPELAQIGADVSAVDKNDRMIATVWPGDTPNRRAVHANWRALPFPDACFTAAVGDGAFNVIAMPADHRAVTAELARVLRRGARLAARIYVAPEEHESGEAAVRAAMDRRIQTFGAFKWRLAMSIADPSVAVADVRDLFNRLCPDRDRLASASGWPRAEIDTIDVYAGSAEVYCFPSAADMVAMLPPAFTGARVVPTGGYELAERCPLLIATRA